ncbi:transposase [Bathymodiolus septemdierum thioautotrophic gill symbiont]|uniref:transposase n=1 Tax=Bathymodiolus septemdierum thioautotrophic gill symbiont TaxID=113267 RepID=UPI0038B561DD
MSLSINGIRSSQVSPNRGDEIGINVATLFAYPEAIRKAIYTTNAIESLNSVIRKSIKNRKIFNHDNSAFKVVFLAIEAASKKWTMPIRNWSQAMNQFIILHEDRLKDYV